MKNRMTALLMICVMAAGILSGCSGNHKQSGNGQVALHITFPETAQGAAAAQSLGDLGVSTFELDVHAAHPASFTPGVIQLPLTLDDSGKNSITLVNLADNDIYVFRAIATNSSGTLLFAGQEAVQIAPAGATTQVFIRLQKVDFDPAIAGTFTGVFNNVSDVSDGSHLSINVTDPVLFEGTYSRFGPGISVSGQLFAFPTSQHNIFDFIFLSPGTGVSMDETGRGTGDGTPILSVPSQNPKLNGSFDLLSGQHLTFKAP